MDWKSFVLAVVMAAAVSLSVMASGL